MLSRTRRAGCHVPSASLSHAVLSLVFFVETGALQMVVMSQSWWERVDQVDSAGRVRKGLLQAPRRAAAEG